MPIGNSDNSKTYFVNEVSKKFTALCKPQREFNLGQ